MAGEAVRSLRQEMAEKDF